MLFMRAYFLQFLDKIAQRKKKETYIGVCDI